jgi:hypothetical protein
MPTACLFQVEPVVLAPPVLQGHEGIQVPLDLRVHKGIKVIQVELQVLLALQVQLAIQEVLEPLVVQDPLDQLGLQVQLVIQVHKDPVEIQAEPPVQPAPQALKVHRAPLV